MPPSPQHNPNNEPTQPTAANQAPPLAASFARGAASPDLPVQRLAAARLDAARAPDGIPTLRRGGGRRAAGSSSGAAPRSSVQRQERRARYLAIAIAVPALLILIWLSIETFAPPLHRPAVGNAPQQAYATTTATTVGSVHGGSGGESTPTAQPTTPPLPGTVPTSGPTVTATPAPPTATPLPPTATPNPQGTDATVTFNRSRTAITLASAIVTGCNGCAFSPSAATFGAPFVNVGQQDIYGQNWNTHASYLPPTTNVTTLVMACGYDSGGVCQGDILPAGTSFDDTTGNYTCNTTQSVRFTASNPIQSVGCRLNKQGYVCFNFVSIYDYGFHLFGVKSQDGQTGTECEGGGGYNIYTMPNNCYVYGNNFADARNDAIGKVRSALDNYAQGYPDLLSGPTENVTAGPYCSDSRGVAVARGNQMPNYSPLFFYQTTYATAYKFVYKKSDVPGLQQARLQAATPANYVFDASHSSVCSAGSVSPTSVDVGGHKATFNCTYTGQAMWGWTSAQQDALRASIAGQSVGGAQGTVVGTQGVAGGVSITITGCAAGKNCTKLPTDPNKIKIVINDP